MFSVFMIPRWRLAALTLLSALFLLFETACQRVPLLAPSGSVISLTSSATVLPFNGTTTITAQLVEAAGTPPHSGTHVTFTTTLGTIQPADAEIRSAVAPAPLASALAAKFGKNLNDSPEYLR